MNYFSPFACLYNYILAETSYLCNVIMKLRAMRLRADTE